MKILGISAFYHDSAAAIINDGKVIAAAQEERFTRKKHDASFPLNAARFCLEYADVSIDDLDAVIFYDKPFLKFERLLETFYAFAPRGVRAFIEAMPVWMREKMFLKKILLTEIEKVERYDRKKLRLLFSEHHLSHAGSAYYISPFDEAAILTVDAVGEKVTSSIYHGRGKEIKTLKEMHFPYSVGLFYSAFTYFLGFRVNSGEYKMMGLAPYGREQSENVRRFRKNILEKLIDVKEDGSLWMNMQYFRYPTEMRMVDDKKFEALFGFPRRTSESEFKQHHCDLAYAVQAITEDILIRMAREARRLTKSSNLCLSGGVALNCVANGKLLREKIFDNIYIAPASGDAGGAVGAAYVAYHIFFGKEKKRVSNNSDCMRGAYLGPEFFDDEIVHMSKKNKAVYKKLNDNELFDTVSQWIVDGKIVGWFQGRMEFGPRALGNRSILGDPRNESIQKKMNLKIKYRESFRPFAPSVLFEERKKYFDLESESPYMLLVAPITQSVRKRIPDEYESMDMMDRLYVQRSTIPAVTHVDFSARIQTVRKETNEKYWKLISKFQEKSGVGLLVNTSFNVRGEPIVCSPEDAYRCFMRTDIDYLVINSYVYKKEDQPKRKDDQQWKEEFVLD